MHLKNLKKEAKLTPQEEKAFWINLAQKTPRKTNKTAVELLREDRLSH